MGTNLAASSYEVEVQVLGQPFILSVTVRIGETAQMGDMPLNTGVVSLEQLYSMATYTIATWQRVMSAIMSNTWKIEAFKGKAWESAEVHAGIKQDENEPFVTVWNKESNRAIGVTVHSWDNGDYALFTAYALVTGLKKIQEYAPQFGFDKLSFNSLPSPKEAPKKDIDDVDSFIPPYSGFTQPANKQTADIPKTTQVKAFVRPAKLGSIPNTIKLEKGAKDKKTWETAILPNTPYSSNSTDFQEKDILVYPILGKIQYKGGANGYYFAIPTTQSEIHIWQREAINHNGSLIESDSQKLIKHLGLTGELTQGMAWEVPATHIAMKVGKTGEKGQFKNYSGLYALTDS